VGPGHGRQAMPRTGIKSPASPADHTMSLSLSAASDPGWSTTC
jgi:hypothetical protein